MSQPAARTSIASIRYEELEIEVARCVCGAREVRILSSQFGRPRERFEPGYDVADLGRRLEQLDELMLHRSSEQRRQLAESIGLDLHAALFPRKVERTLSMSLARLHTLRESAEPEQQSAGLRLRLGFGDLGDGAAEVVGLPWELILDPATRQFVASAPQTPFVRYFDLDRPAKAVAIQPPLRILVVMASPKDYREIDLRAHRKILTDACGNDGRFDPEFLDPPTFAQLNRVLADARRGGRPFHALHFLGHGIFNDAGRGSLLFQDGSGNSAPVAGQDLAMMLQGAPELRLAVLATCVGARMARRRGQHPFTGSASALVAGGLSAVVAMQFPVSERAAAQFTSAFYDYLGSRRSLEEAVTEGRLRILGDDPGTIEWASPVLFLRASRWEVSAPERKPVGEMSRGKSRQAGREFRGSIEVERGIGYIETAGPIHIGDVHGPMAVDRDPERARDGSAASSRSKPKAD
jgi:hypothetical protein